ncbi:hypothetical protein LTR36_008429 [Oleoguttula mirabilis]|uniref:Cytochrome P450 n=1 Tax=Oleoguttula mirabilis TaxID=1507867 RepID=A0AAV9J799_9PEZI|nr:hypothetical protein LTR36_008429 [Oleoguttula mirabilis]
MLDFIGSHLAVTAVCAIALTYAPGPPGHSMIWGHLKIMGSIMQDVPARVHPHVIPLRIKEKYNIETDYFYLDVWPLADPMLHVFDPDVAQQVTVDLALPKHSTMADFMIHLAGPGDMVSSNGPHWKKWRTIMNPGFAASHLISLVPGIVDDSLIFCQRMVEHAEKGEIFRLEENATRLTVDIIGKVTMDLKLNTQSAPNEMVTAFREQVQLVPNEGMLDPLAMWRPKGIYKRWRNGRVMNRYIGKVLDERFARADNIAGRPVGERKQRKRVMIDLALDAYQSQQSGGEAEKAQVNTNPPQMDAEFRRAAITQIRTFVFAGHDTTSSTICYALYMLQKNPECMARIRQEHDENLGGVESAPQLIKDDPHILKKLDYTMCVVRETLRLWPAAGAVRGGLPGVMIRDPKTGESYPTENFLVWVPHYALHRNPNVWGDSANTFDPSRFLAQNESKLPENGYRPFEKGQRNCIGQELALIEARIILALTVRSFEFQAAYDSLDEPKDDGSYYADERWRKGKQDLDGEEAYQILVGSAKPREGMPTRVKVRL